MKKMKNISKKIIKNPFIIVLVLTILFYAGVATSYRSSGIAKERENKLALLSEIDSVNSTESKDEAQSVLNDESNEAKQPTKNRSNKSAAHHTTNKVTLKNKESSNASVGVTPCTIKYKKHPAVYKTIKGAEPIYEKQTWYVFIDGKVFYSIEDAESYAQAINKKYITWDKNILVRPGEPDVEVLVKPAWVEKINCE